MNDRPFGTVTFLFTDIEGSTRLWEHDQESMRSAMVRHDMLVDVVVEEHNGYIVRPRGEGDSRFVVFRRASDAVAAACALQKALSTEPWPTRTPLRVRIALHTGEAELRMGDYYGPAVNRCARLRGVAHGGQTLISGPTAAMVRDVFLDDVSLKDLGVHRLKDLAYPEHIYQLVIPELPEEFPPLNTIDLYPHNLPIQPTPFFGRERELAEIETYLLDPSCRMLSLIGPGGIGKSRLAIQAAAGRIEDYTHGVWFFPLASLTSDDFLIPTIASALGFSFYGIDEPKAQLFNYLREKQMLLVIDNFEHLLAGAPLLADIIAIAPDVRLLVTSRERLNLQGETIYEVQSLDYPTNGNHAENFSAMELFDDRARRVNSCFTISDEELPEIVKICQLVDGMPLAIELAAAWVRVLSCSEIVREIERDIDFLETTKRDVPIRHQSIRSMFAHSWDLLSESEKGVLRRQSVFRGGFRRDAGEKVAGASLGLLAALVDKSLLRRSPEGRYTRHTLIWEYAREKLREHPHEEKQVKDLHCSFFASFLHEREEALQGEKQKEALAEIREEIENIRLAWGWALDQGKTDEISKAAEPLSLFYESRSWFQEGEKAFGEAIAVLRDRIQATGESPKELESILGSILGHQAGLFVRLGSYERAKELAEESLSITRRTNNRPGMADAHNNLGNVAYRQGNHTQAKDHYTKSLELWRDIGDQKGLGMALNNLSNVVASLGNYQRARQLLRESLAIFKEIGYLRGIAACNVNLGYIAEWYAELEAARKLHQESLAIRNEIGDQLGIAESFFHLGFIASELGEIDESIQYHRESLKIRKDIGHRWGIAQSINALGHVAHLQGDYADADRMCRESLDICKEIGDQWGIANALENLGVFSSAQGDYDKAIKLHQEALAIRREIGIPGLVADSICNLAEAHFGMGDYEEAETLLQEALQLAYETGLEPAVLRVLVGIAELRIRKGDHVVAAKILSLVRTHPKSVKQLKNKAEKLNTGLLEGILPGGLEIPSTQSLRDIVKEILDK